MLGYRQISLPSPRRREALIRQTEALGLKCVSVLVDPNAVLSDNLQIGDASFLNAGVIVGAVAKIGSGVLINRAAFSAKTCRGRLCA